MVAVMIMIIMMRFIRGVTREEEKRVRMVEVMTTMMKCYKDRIIESTAFWIIKGIGAEATIVLEDDLKVRLVEEVEVGATSTIGTSIKIIEMRRCMGRTLQTWRIKIDKIMKVGTVYMKILLMKAR